MVQRMWPFTVAGMMALGAAGTVPRLAAADDGRRYEYEAVGTTEWNRFEEGPGMDTANLLVGSGEGWEPHGLKSSGLKPLAGRLAGGADDEGGEGDRPARHILGGGRDRPEDGLANLKKLLGLDVSHGPGAIQTAALRQPGLLRQPIAQAHPEALKNDIWSQEVSDESPNSGGRDIDPPGAGKRERQKGGKNRNNKNIHKLGQQSKNKKLQKRSRAQAKADAEPVTEMQKWGMEGALRPEEAAGPGEALPFDELEGLDEGLRGGEAVPSEHLFFVPVGASAEGPSDEYVAYDPIPVDHSLWHGQQNLTIQSAGDEKNAESQQRRSGHRRSLGQGPDPSEEWARGASLRSLRTTRGRSPRVSDADAYDDEEKAAAAATELKSQNQFTLYLPVNEHGIATDMPTGTQNLTYALEPNTPFTEHAIDVFDRLPDLPELTLDHNMIKRKHKKGGDTDASPWALNMEKEGLLAEELKKALWGPDRPRGNISTMTKGDKGEGRGSKGGAHKGEARNKGARDDSDEEQGDKQNLIAKLVSRFVDVDALAKGHIMQALNPGKKVTSQAAIPDIAPDPFNTAPEFISAPHHPKPSQVVVDIPSPKKSKSGLKAKKGSRERSSKTRNATRD